MSRRLAALALGVALLAGCRLDLDVHVAVETDGSGTVEVIVGLDADGIERIGGDLAAVLEVDDLAAAGWTVSEPSLDDDGVTRLRVRRAFADADEATIAFREIAGPEGPFRDLALEHSSGFARTRWDFTGRLDLRGGVEAFSDAAVAAELDGEPLGVSVEAIEAQLGEPLSEVIEVGVEVRLPGEVTANGSTPAPGTTTWRLAYGDEPLAMSARGEETRVATLVGAGVVVTSVAALLLGGLWSWRRGRREPSAPPPAA